jgi:hypothetical protein
MKRQILDPIHLPCPDMAGCINPDPNKTLNSLNWVDKCLRGVRAISHMNKAQRAEYFAARRAQQLRKQDEAPEMGADSLRELSA